MIAVLALVLSAALIWFLVELFQPFHGSGHGSVTVTIPAHSSSSEVGDILERDGVIASSFFFEIRAFLSGDKSKLRAGTYHLEQDMSYAAALSALSTPPPPVKTTGVTIVPGSTRAQISARLHAERVGGNYAAATRHSRLLNPVDYGAPRSTPSLEGFLFPDTYQLRVPVSISALVADQLTAFKQRFGTVRMGYARSKHLTPYDVLIVASIIEREAATAHDQPLVASVIYNRLHGHIPLGMDSTTRYEFNDYTNPLTQSQLSARSPYNTRLHAGLPPTPISNPSLAAIRAAANPRSHQLPLLRGQAVRQRCERLRVELLEVPAGLGALPVGACTARGPLARELLRLAWQRGPASACSAGRSHTAARRRSRTPPSRRRA